MEERERNEFSTIRVEKGPLRYVLKIPAARPRTSHPVLLFLHGYDEGAPTDIHEALTRHGPLRHAKPGRSVEHFIIVAPQLPTRGDVWHHYAGAVQMILRDVQRQHQGNAKRAYLTGFSFGGNGVFDLALIQPDTWAALWAVDPTRVPAKNPPQPIWLSFGQVARYRKDDFIRALDVRPIVESGAADRVYLDQRADHVGSARLAYRDEQIYRWLLSKRLAFAPDP